MMNGREKSQSAIAARKEKTERFTALLHITSIRSKRARKLADLHSPVPRGAYRPQPSPRVYIPRVGRQNRPRSNYDEC